MALISEIRVGRTNPSRLISELREKRRLIFGNLDPERKMNAAFSLSVEARKFLLVGLKAQGFTEAEILETLRKRWR